MLACGASHSQAVLLPLGVRPTRWLTQRAVHDSEQRLLVQSRLFGMQVYRPDSDVASPLRVRYRSWWALHQVAELVVDLEPDPSSPAGTAVSVSAGLRVGAAIAALVWIAALLVPLLVFSPLPTRIFFAVMLILPVISALFIARLQVRSSLRRLRLTLPPARRSATADLNPRRER
jgi:hypothetical protein